MGRVTEWTLEEVLRNNCRGYIVCYSSVSALNTEIEKNRWNMRSVLPSFSALQLLYDDSDWLSAF